MMAALAAPATLVTVATEPTALTLTNAPMEATTVPQPALVPTTTAVSLAAATLDFQATELIV